jgi:hypothetical protein
LFEELSSRFEPFLVRDDCVIRDDIFLTGHGRPPGVID